MVPTVGKRHKQMLGYLSSNICRLLMCYNQRRYVAPAEFKKHRENWWDCTFYAEQRQTKICEMVYQVATETGRGVTPFQSALLKPQSMRGQ